jgi:hypothetical protein
MTRSNALLTLVAVTLLSMGTATAHEVEVLFNRKDPIVVAVKYRKIVHVRFWEAVLDASTTIPTTSLDIQQDEDFANTIILTNLAKKTHGMVYVMTASGVVVSLKIEHWGDTTQMVNVKDARTEAERAVQRANEQTQMSAEERAVRNLWRAQWGFPTDASVQVWEMHQVIETTDAREITLVKRYETVGFYGFTQKIRNLSSDVVVMHPATIELNCPLFSVALDGHIPALSPGDDPHRITPGGSVFVHLTCKGARRASIH